MTCVCVCVCAMQQVAKPPPIVTTGDSPPSTKSSGRHSPRNPRHAPSGPRQKRAPSGSEASGPVEWKKGELIGKGAFGKVYMAMNKQTGELIAVKQVQLSTQEDQELAKSIQSEIRLMRHLRHPNIVNLLGA